MIEYSCHANGTNGKRVVIQQPSLLQINPSYAVGVLPENAEETEAFTINAHVYVSDPQKTTADAEEHDYVCISPSCSEQLQTPNKQPTTVNDSELMNDDEVNYI